MDIKLFWERANFYLIVQAGLISLFFTSYQEISLFEKEIIIIIPAIGLMIAVFWFITLIGCIKWIRLWRKEVVKLDEQLDPYRVYARIEETANISPIWSPSYITHILPIGFIIGWIVIASKHSLVYPDMEKKIPIVPINFP